MMRDLTRGIVRENPVFVTLLGLCPSLAVTTRVANAIGLGTALIVVLVLTGLTVSLLRDAVPVTVRTPVWLAIIAVFVTLVDLFMVFYVPALSESLGMFVPLMVVNCIIMGRADAFARHVAAGRAVLDALGTGVGFLLSLTLIALVREVLGAGTVTLFPVGSFDGTVVVPGLSQSPVRVATLSAGALLVVGYLLALFVRASSRRADAAPADGAPPVDARREEAP